MGDRHDLNVCRRELPEITMKGNCLSRNLRVEYGPVVHR